MTGDNRVLVHGITGRYASVQVPEMLRAGTRIVAGVSVGQGGSRVHDVPVFDTAAEAVAATGADASVVYVPAAGVRDAIFEHVDAGIRTIMVAAEFVPLADSLQALAHARRHGAWVIGPNSLGLISPGVGLLGSIAAGFCSPGRVGLISRSGTLTLATTRALTQAGIGQSTAVHVGGDVVCGRNPSEYLTAFAADPDTEVIAYCGEIGGTKEYDLIEHLGSVAKPVAALIVGRSAPPERRMGHAGALAGAARETAQAKREALATAGAHLADDPVHLTGVVRALLQ
ncbi:MAG: succinate--CoA ligase subunit alpha [Burkholderiales bacterium]|nr:MAG: succinate--CoA ligase subunit alpha [Burkholderiales bacterium]